MPSPPQKEAKCGNENEPPIDHASMFLRTPGNNKNQMSANKGGVGTFFEGLLANSENKMNVSPFFNKK